MSEEEFELVNRDCIITGGSGAIGSNLVRRLLSMKARSVFVIDNLSSGFRWLLPNDDRVIFVQEDVANLSNKTISTEEPYVFHLAAFFANQNSVDHPEDDLHTNGLGTLKTLIYAAKNQARRLVYASAGCSIAGHGIEESIREDMPVSLFLDTPYQITKALGEFYCNYFLHQVSTVRCRFFNSYGPGEVPGKYRNVIPNFIWLALHNQPLTITGTGDETRDFIYVDDLVTGLIRGALVEDANGQAFNLGTSIETRIGDLAEMIIRLTSSKSRIQYAPRRIWDKSARRQADISQARDTLKFRPKFVIEEGLGLTVEWFKQNIELIRKSVKGEL